MKVLFKHHDEGDRFKDETMRERFRKAVLFYERELLSLYPNVTKEELDSTTITLVDLTQLRDDASCSRHRTDPRKFYIVMVFNPKCITDVIEKLAHELCHVMQHIAGFLSAVDTDEHHVLWKGKEFERQMQPYHKRPWEKDAMINTFELHRRYRRAVSGT